MQIRGMDLGKHDLLRLGRLIKSVPGVRIFKDPLQVLRCYFSIKFPPRGYFELRDGLRIFMSDHPWDVVTAYIIFVRREYGAVPRGGVVVDVGANIGVYSLYAAWQGARKVYAFEPSRDSYRVLCRNIEENGLSDVIVPYRLAMTGVDGDTVRFPTNSDIGNAVQDSSRQGGDYEEVGTISLARVMADHGLDTIDVLKLDCEGSEYEILNGASDQLLDAIKSLKMEYHCGHMEEILARLHGRGLSVNELMVWSREVGNIWFSRSSGPAGKNGNG